MNDPVTGIFGARDMKMGKAIERPDRALANAGRGEAGNLDYS